jgi:hypothetical protein
LLKGHPPPTGSIYYLAFDPVISQAELDRLPTADLLALMISDRRQKNLVSQLRVRTTVCRRLAGTVISTWDAHPVCLHDALHDWPGLHWPALTEGQQLTRNAISAQAFERSFMQARPQAFIWAHRWQQPPPRLLPEARRMLACCYDVHDGFAIAKKAAPGKP